MFTPSFTIAQDGQALKTITDKERAVSVAKALAATTDKDVTVTAHLDAVTDRDVVFHPDGTNEKIWIIDMGRRMEPVVGQVYTNRGGGHFRCIAPADAGSTLERGVKENYTIRLKVIDAVFHLDVSTVKGKGVTA